MDKVKKMLLVHIPTGRCNFKCPYCFITLNKAWEGDRDELNRTEDEIRKAFDMKRFGGPCYVNLCASGETLIYPQVVGFLKAILENGHYVELVTNGSLTQRFQEISKFPKELLERLSFKFSLQYTELLRLGLMDTFFENVNLMRSSGASINVELTPVDEEEQYIDEIKKICKEKVGAWCHITIARDDRDEKIPVLSEHTLDEYYNIWSTFDSNMIDFEKSVFQQYRNEFCYAGAWSLYINLFTGDMRQCYQKPVCGNIYDYNRPIPEKPVGKCHLSHCYNAHMLMTLGLLPDADTPTYTQIRNRVCEDGSEWLQPKVKSFFNSKLSESNELYSEEEKKKYIKEAKSFIRRRKIKKIIKRPITKISGIINKEK